MYIIFGIHIATRGDAMPEMANDDVKLPVTLSLSSKSIYGSIFAKDNSPAEKLIDDAVDAAFNDKVVAEMEKFKKKILIN